MVIESEGVECRGGYIVIWGVGIYFIILRFLFIVLCKTGFLIWPRKASPAQRCLVEQVSPWALHGKIND